MRKERQAYVQARCSCTSVFCESMPYLRSNEAYACLRSSRKKKISAHTRMLRERERVVCSFLLIALMSTRRISWSDVCTLDSDGSYAHATLLPLKLAARSRTSSVLMRRFVCLSRRRRRRKLRERGERARER